MLPSKAWAEYPSTVTGIWYGGGQVTVGSTTMTMGSDAVAMGYENVAGGAYSVAMGYMSNASGWNAVAMCEGNTAKGAYSVAIGNGAYAGPDNSFAFGGTVADAHTGSVALGYGSVTGGAYEVSVGSSTQTRKITNVTAGTADTDAVNYSQLKSVTDMGSTAGSIYAKDATVVEAVKSIDTKIGSIASGTYACIAAGNTVSANLVALDGAVKTLQDSGIDATKVAQIETNKNNISANKTAIDILNGDAATAGSVKNIAKGYSTISVAGTAVTNSGIGVNFVAGDNVSLTTSGNTITISATGGGGGGSGTGINFTMLGKDSVASAEGSTAIGYNNIVSGKYSTAVGYKNEVTGNNSGAFGDPNVISGDGSFAVGNNNTIAGDNNFVLGNNVNVGSNVTNSVVLGNGSAVTEDNVVSVGSETVKRKITNIAPGTAAYDAVNYAQYSDLANNMERRFSKVNEDIGRTGAASAALASLHPQMMRKGESQVMAGMGRYHGKSGAAVGLAWQPHKRVMLSGGFADAAGEIMFNVGASYKFGQHSYTPEQLAEIYNGNGTPLYVAELNAALKSKDVQIMNLKSDNAAIKAELAELKAIVAQLVKAKK